MSDSADTLFAAVYTDEDVTADLAPALRRRGFRAMSTPEAGNIGRSDEEQLAYAAEHGYVLLTYNAADFIELAARWFDEGRSHAGIVLSEQYSQRQFGELLRRTLQLLDQLPAYELADQLLFLQAFRPD